ncbi:Biotin carboxyl carrier protein of acetyl-CoA carboxylase [Beijerinckiaceae bacterium RH AL1]|nr:acetyl-CoA carboxylase biotin carboxyl carrier protein [Beijerinckiaceae bacterium]VVB45885.1 Biotin carboxyl carrier protein of acetyl-CoA carboxylase [Beijerinckiaceae bacterium RH CH11]VVB45963.1 Biotin carboxyl carrier protein of acetyl-CoA carboxylase [Beijerinckiaceae bacterium RH AL8]VVC55090.1 Biotin carboxyl carrier protein of acetyl-CoA carboxylase [Beijerinckiaceae bacterium RH AL1]
MTSKKSAENGNGAQTELVESLADIAKRLDLSEIEYQLGELKIRVARQMATTLVQMPAAAHAPAAAPAAPVAAAAAADAMSEHPGTVKSPMVGTAYLRPAPESPPFVDVGSVVKAGDKILLVEAMKTFNEIIAPKGGTVTQILVGDGQPVEYGQALFVIE